MKPPLKKVGFWRPTGDHLGAFAPLIAALSQVAGLADPADHVDLRWSSAERETVLSYVEDLRFRSTAYLGFSECRICQRVNGCADYSDGVYMWPQGFGHYIRVHNIRPPQDFIQHVLRSKRR